MIFQFGALAVLACALIIQVFKERPRGDHISKKALARHLTKVEAEEARIERDRLVYELAKDLVDGLATDRTCQHEDDWWLGDRCRQCAILYAKEVIHKAMEVARG